MSGAHEPMPVFDEARGELAGKGGEDYVVLSAVALRNINKDEETALGTGSFVIWYNAGKAVGSIDGRKFKHLMESMDLDKFASYMQQSYMRYGWGLIGYSLKDFDSGTILFTVKNSPLVKGVHSKQPRCWFVKGFAEGLTTELLGVQTTATETKCQAVDGDHCEFELRWTSQT